jgi:H+/Cl- antiporter ClcA
VVVVVVGAAAAAAAVVLFIQCIRLLRNFEKRYKRGVEIQETIMFLFLLILGLLRDMLYICLLLSANIR